MPNPICSALSPTPPFAQNTARLRMAAPILPVFFLSLIVEERTLYRSVTLGIGFAMFGRPLIDMINTAQLKTWLEKY